MSLPWRATETGVEVAVRLTPKGGRDQLDGIGEDASGKTVLLVRVSAPPVNGAANKALLKFLAKTGGIAKSRVRFIAGETSRIKRLHLEGDSVALIKQLTAALA